MRDYSKLFSVNVRHNYYQDNLCQDLIFVPTQQSSLLMLNQLYLYQNFATGFNLVREVDTGQPKIKLQETQLHFGIGLKQAAKFFAITNLNEASPAKEFLSNKKIYLTNNGLNENLKLNIIDAIVGDSMNLNFILAANSEITLRVNTSSASDLIIAYNTDGTPIASPYKIKKGEDGTFAKLLDLSKLPDGLYTISIKNAADTGEDLLTYKIFKSNELQLKSNFGVLDLKLPGIETAVEETKFVIDFTRKETIWNYYVVNRSGSDLDDFDFFIHDKSADGTSGGNPVYSKYTFLGTAVPDNDTDSITKISDGKITVFKSNTKIPFFQKLKTGLELSKNVGPTKVIISKHLPNPTPENQSGEESKIYIYV
ncbi:hypothetical protein [Pedobacter sp. Leaf250]|uniref:hypothetical protein n=1 Tax=Pedobacter sp. Leaf250 TaxID=2876559 RepID=UPI001E34D698|nr:hypothetical protein [Pedobacter sp. Leaf250]